MASSSEDKVRRTSGESSASPPPAEGATAGSRPHKNTTHEDNPFVTFREFAKEQVSSLLQSVIALPSMTATPIPNQWPILDAQPMGLRERRNDYHDAQQTERAPRGSTDNIGDGRNYRSRIDDDDEFEDWKDQDPWRPRNRRSKFFEFEPDTFLSDRFPFFSLGRWPAFPSLLSDPFTMGLGDDTPQAWAIPYLLFSPYSPLHLERSSRDRDSSYDGIFSSLFSSMRPSASSVESGSGSEPRWRDAFEDLLRLENGKPMLSRPSDPSAITNRNTESGTEWLRGLVQRGSLGDDWKLVAGPNKHSPCGIALERRTEQQEDGSHRNTFAFSSSKDADTDSEEAATELDLYDRFLSDITTPHGQDEGHALFDSPLMRLLFDERERRRHRERWEQQQRLWEEQSRLPPRRESQYEDHEPEAAHHASNDLAVRESSSSTPSDNHNQLSSVVLSTMTRTERISRPDGSVETKTVKTQRFADGREESNESVEVVHPHQQSQAHASAAKESSDEPIAASKHKGGWFWSE